MDGIIPVWKERGMTSHDVVFKLRRILHEKKIGHTGTLDPDVDGVLVCCVGEGTKLVSLMTDKVKEYVGEITLGFSTDTEDASGEIIASEPLNVPVSDQTIQSQMQTLVGEITQIPPMYSAVKVNGRRLYDYARNGETVERPKRQITVHQFDMTDVSIFDSAKGRQTFSFHVVCGKGTYVRTLATDLGNKLGIPATMTRLTRQGVKPFDAADCLTLDDISDKMANNDRSFLHPVEQALADYPVWHVPDSLVRLVENGAVLHRHQLPDTLPVCAYIGEHLKAIYDVHPTQVTEVKPVKMFR